MDAATAFAVGQAITQVLKRNAHVPRVIIGKDTRISGYMLESALESGVTSMGGMAYLVGVMPTPAIAYLTESMRADAGLVDIGFAQSLPRQRDQGLRGQRVQALGRAGEPRSRSLVLAGSCRRWCRRPGAWGRAKRLEDAQGRYIVFLKNTFPRGPDHGRAEGGHGRGQRRHIQGGAGRLHGTGRRSHRHPRRAERLQHQRRLRLAAHARISAGWCAGPVGHRAGVRRRRRPADRRGREGQRDHRRPDPPDLRAHAAGRGPAQPTTCWSPP